MRSTTSRPRRAARSSAERLRPYPVLPSTVVVPCASISARTPRAPNGRAPAPIPLTPRSTLLPYTTLFRSEARGAQLCGTTEAVSGLALDGGGPVRQHLGAHAARLREHRPVVGLGERARRARDPAPAAADLLVRDAGDLLLVLLRAPAGERQVSVAVDEARHDRRDVDHAVRARGVVERDDHAGLARD